MLKDAGLVRDVRQGTYRIYQIEDAALSALREWLDAVWDQALEG